MTHAIAKQFTNMIKESQLLNDVCSDFFNKTGVRNFGYVEIDEQGDFIYLYSDPRLPQLLIDANIMQYTPLRMITDHPKEGVYMSCLSGKPSLSQEPVKGIIDFLQLENFNIFLQKTSINDKNFIRMFSYAGKKGDNKINHFYVNYQELFLDFNKYFLDRFSMFLNKVEKVKTKEEIKNTYQEKFNKVKNKEAIECNFMKNKKIKVYAHGMYSSDYKVTLREREVVQMYASGLNTQDIAGKLFISRRTVERHFENLRKRFNCRNRQQLSNILEELNLL